MRWGDTIEVEVDVNDVLSQLTEEEVIKYFQIKTLENCQPIDLLSVFKRLIEGKRLMSPTDLKDAICNWIDDNVYNHIT